jgi:hypothetical protein
MNKYILILLLAVIGWSCQGGQADQTTDSNPTSTSTPAAETNDANASAPVAAATYPSITKEMVQMLWEKCDYVDFVFYYLNFSMSQKVQNSIRQTIAHISSTVPQIDPNCKPIGRLFFQAEGKNIAEADIFYSNGCAYYIFYENGQYAYANQMLPQGSKFYDNIFQQVQAQKK